jgi:hypothetical protein
MAEAGIEAKAKRQCEGCKAVIPAWRKGRKVSKSVRFAQRNTANGLVGPQPDFVRPNIQKVPVLCGLFTDAPVIDNQRIGDDGIDRALFVGDLALAHAVADHLAAAEFHFLAVNCKSLFLPR